MSESEKTEEPTSKRRGKYAEEGKIATSRDIGGVAIGLSCLLIFVLDGHSLTQRVTEVFRQFATNVEQVPQSDPKTMLPVVLLQAGWAVLSLSGTILATTAGVAIVAGVAQTGGNWASKAYGFKLEHLNPIAGLQRAMFSMSALIQLGLSALKAAVLGLTLWIVLRGYLPGFLSLSRLELGQALAFVGHVLFVLVLAALLTSAVLAVADYAINRYRTHEQMKMTKQEVKDEFKQQEGDPEVKARMRQKMRQIGRRQMIAATRKADVVVVNPTHYAVALEYKFGQTGAPKLLAKGKDEVAARIREVARKHQIPIVANPPVARAIHAGARVGQEVPAELYEVVAKVIAYLYRLRNARLSA